MVIAIIGMLAALVTVAAQYAIAKGRNAQITVEIGLLDSAVQTYKNDTGGAYPPDCSLISTTTARQNRILSHLRKAFPRLIVPAGYGPASTAGTLQYMSQKAFSQSVLYGPSGTQYAAFSGTTPGGFTWGDFDNMDPAEALVFWLGGFAVPYKDPQTGKLTYKLIGFGSNKVGNALSSGPTASGPNSGFGPFNLDVSSRDAGPFEFYQGRLGDADGDGWPEYYPPVGQVAQPPSSAVAIANPTPPYVYFDAVSYGSFTSPMTTYPGSAAYPATSGTGTGAQPFNYAQWGTAIPYVQTVPTSGTMTWVEPQGFQIICAGLDLMYWFSPTGTPAPLTLRIYPTGINYSEGDLDNLTCFTSSTLRSAQP